MNTSSPSWRWVAGIAITAIGMLGGFAASQTVERINVLESWKESRVEYDTQTRERLARMEAKIDRLLEERKEH